MFNRTPQLLAAIAIFFSATTSTTEAAEAGPVMKRVAKTIGRALERRRATAVRIVPSPKFRTEFGKKLETKFRGVLESDSRINELNDDAKLALQVDYVVSSGRVAMKVTLLDRSNDSLGQFVANFDVTD